MGASLRLRKRTRLSRYSPENWPSLVRSSEYQALTSTSYRPSPNPIKARAQGTCSNSLA
ncbi:hypothetical protein D3C87_1105080 [compost metagenome]